MEGSGFVGLVHLSRTSGKRALRMSPSLRAFARNDIRETRRARLTLGGCPAARAIRTIPPRSLPMPPVTIANPILNSPYREPNRHFRFDANDQITDIIDNGRRDSSYFIPIARPKKKTANNGKSSTCPPWRKVRLVRVTRPVRVTRAVRVTRSRVNWS